MKVTAVYKVSNSNKVIRVLSGASCLTQILIFENTKDIPKDLPVITLDQAREITGNYTL